MKNSTKIIKTLIERYRRVGVGGSRSVVPPEFQELLKAMPASWMGVCVGCAKGVDAAVRRRLPLAEVFSACAYGEGKQSFVRRTMATVEKVAAEGSGLWVAAPSGPCPPEVLPSASGRRCFNGGGSGTWAGAAYAAGLGLPVLLLSQSGAPPFWGFEKVAGTENWYLKKGSQLKQLSLF